MFDTVSGGFILVMIVFMTINLLIVKVDIMVRTIRNIYIIWFLMLLPFWFIYSNSVPLVPLAHILFASILLIGGIMYYREDGFLGSGDLKYAAILTLFLSERPLTMIIGNIGALTVIALFVWWSMLCGAIYTLRQYMPPRLMIPELRESKKLIQSGLIIILDWIIIGYIFAEIIQICMYMLYGSDWISKDIYFLVSIGVFLLRSSVRKYLFEGKYKQYGFIGIILFLLYKIQLMSVSVFLIDIYGFMEQIWIYAVIFIILYSITRHTFRIYDRMIQDAEIQDNIYKTIPYSLILFVGFCITYFGNISLLDIVRLWFE